MIKSRILSIVLCAVLLAVTADLGVLRAQDSFDSRELLKMMRQKDGQPAESNDAEKPAEPANSNTAEVEKIEQPVEKRELVDLNSIEIVTEKPEARFKELSAPEPVVTEIKSGDDFLEMVPAESLLVVRVNHFEGTLAGVDQYLAGISPVPMGLRMLVRMQLSQVLGSAQLAGVNTNGTFGFIALPSDNPGQPLAAVLIPVTNYQQFVSGNANVTDPDSRGISIVNNVGALMQNGDYAVFAENAENLEMVISKIKVGGFAGVIDMEQRAAAATSPVWACVNMQRVNQAYGGIIDAQMAQMKMQLDSMPAGPRVNAMATNYDNMVRIKELMGQMKFVAVKLEPKANVINITETFAGLQGSKMSEVLVKSPGSMNREMQKFLKNGALMNMMINADWPLLRELTEYGTEMNPKLAELSDAERAAFMQAQLDNIDSMEGTAAASLTALPGSQPPFVFEQVTPVSDPDKFKNALDQNLNLAKKINADVMDFTLTPNSSNYKGVSVETVDISFKGPAAMMLGQFLGQGLETKRAMVGDTYVNTLGNDPEAKMQELIDKVQSGQGGVPSEVAEAMGMIEGADQADALVTLNLLRVIELVKPMASMMMPGLGNIVIPQSSSNVVLAARSGEGQLRVDIALPKEQVAGIAQVVGPLVMSKFGSVSSAGGPPKNVPITLRKPNRSGRQMNQPNMPEMVEAEPNPNAVPGTVEAAPKNDREKRMVTKKILRLLHAAVRQYKIDTGQFPNDLQDLVQKPASVEKYPEGGYLNSSEVPKDGWGNEFEYITGAEMGSGFEIVSLGSDGKEGGKGFAMDMSTDPRALKRRQRMNDNE